MAHSQYIGKYNNKTSPAYQTKAKSRNSKENISMYIKVLEYSISLAESQARYLRAP